MNSQFQLIIFLENTATQDQTKNCLITWINITELANIVVNARPLCPGCDYFHNQWNIPCSTLQYSESRSSFYTPISIIWYMQYIFQLRTQSLTNRHVTMKHIRRTLDGKRKMASIFGIRTESVLFQRTQFLALCGQNYILRRATNYRRSIITDQTKIFCPIAMNGYSLRETPFFECLLGIKFNRTCDQSLKVLKNSQFHVPIQYVLDSFSYLLLLRSKPDRK